MLESSQEMRTRRCSEQDAAGVGLCLEKEVIEDEVKGKLSALETSDVASETHHFQLQSEGV